MKRSTNELSAQSNAALARPPAPLFRLPLQQARKASFARDRLDKEPHFLAMMSHEIRTPMNSLLGMLELLAKTVLTQEQRNMLRVSRDSARTLARVADDMLGESIMGTHRVALECVPVDIRQLMIDLVALLSADSRRRQLVIRHELDPALAPVLLTDPIRLRQILLNLATNALKFTPHGEIVLQVIAHDVPDTTLVNAANGPNTTHMAQKVIIRVRDSGRGMSPDMLMHAWEPFAQGVNASADLYGGTGLGLTIARQLARGLGGELTMESIPERGTTACLTLELRRPTPSFMATPLVHGMRSIAFGHVRSALLHADTFAADFVAANAPPIRGRRSTDGGFGGSFQNPHRLRMRAGAARRDARAQVSLRILVADDHPASRLVLHRQLAQLGHRADVVEDGAAGMARLRAQRYDVLFTDHRMPEMDGYALVHAWRQLEKTTGVLPMPVIGFSASPLENRASHSEAVVMDDCLLKPITLRQLRASLATVLASNQGTWTSHVIDFARRNDDVPPALGLDLDRLAHSFGGTDALHHILRAFVAATVEDLAVLRPFMGKADPTQSSCRRRLHRIVGGLQVLGNVALAEEGAALELRLIRSSDDVGVPLCERGPSCDPRSHRPNAQSESVADTAGETLSALRCAIRQFCIKITLHIDWLMRKLAT